jgi:diguanylate cyclase (GGDEF)-like protein
MTSSPLPAPFSRAATGRATGLRQRAAWLALATSLLMGLALDASAAAAVKAEPADTLIEALADEGRARPLETARALLALASEPYSVRRRETMFARGVLLAAARQLDTAETIAHEFDQWDEERPDPIVRASAMLLRVRIALRRGDSKSAEPLAVQSLALLPPDAPVLVKFRHVRQLAELRNDALRVDDALRLWHDALKLANESGRAARRVDALSHLAFAYHAAGQAERARRFSDESIAVAEEANDWMSIANAYNTRAILYDAAGDMAGERRALQNAIDNARRAGAKAEESLFSANMSNFFLMTNEPKTAIAYAERALPLARQVGDTEGEVVALSNMGLGYIALRQIDTGKRLVNEALAIEQQRGMVASVADGNRELGAALERAGDAAGAIAALHAYRHDSDAILRSGTQKAMLAVQEQFDADQRSTQLELLYRENRLKAEQLKRGTLLQQLWLVLGLLFALSIIGVTVLYRRVRRTNQALVASNQMLKVQSERDPLTGLANRRYFQGAMQKLAPDGKIVGTVALIDVDHFKCINDSHGHAAGDAVLEEVSRRLRAALRDDDMIVRWGGEEFLVVAQTTAGDTADTLAQRMLNAISDEPVVYEGRHIAVTASIGFATFPIAPTQLAVAWERAIRLVDAAMYLAKDHGRNRGYGVKLLHARDEAGIDAVAGELELACREGKVALTLLQGQQADLPCEAEAEWA